MSGYTDPPRRFRSLVYVRPGVSGQRSARERHVPRGCRRLNADGERCSLQAGHRGECE